MRYSSKVEQAIQEAEADLRGRRRRATRQDAWAVVGLVLFLALVGYGHYFASMRGAL